MISRHGLFVAVLVVVLITYALPTLAQGPIRDVYVDLNRVSGNEDGSQAQPYNTEKEGKAFAQSLTYGGRLHVVEKDGQVTVYLVDPVKTGPQGTPLPRLVAYALLAILALAMLAIGQQLRHRSAPAG